MARKRFNKKVALIGSAAFFFLAVMIIGALLYFGRDPEKFIAYGDAAYKAAMGTTEPTAREEQYGQAERNYRKAFGYARTDALKVDVLFKLSDVFMGLGQWRDVLGCWNQIIRIDDRNIKARLGRLQYSYILAEDGISQLWREVATQASEWLDITEKSSSPAELLTEDIAKWDIPGMFDENTGKHRLGPYLYLLRGRANLAMARLGMVTNADETLVLAVGDLEKVRELEPENVQIYRYLANAAVAQGEVLASSGKLEARQEGDRRAVEILQNAVKIADSSVEAHTNLLAKKLLIARNDDTDQMRNKILALEPEFESLVQRFSTDGRAFAALADFCSDFRLGSDYLDKAIEAIEKAVSFDKENVDYAFSAASLYYKKFTLSNSSSDLDKAIETAKNALNLPAIQETSGPRMVRSRTYRMVLNGFLAGCYIDLILDSPRQQVDSQGEQWLADAEQTVHAIEQILGSGEDPQVVKWQGMLELAKSRLGKGDRKVAIGKLYGAYEQLKASARTDASLSYRLAKLYQNTPDAGAVLEFLTSALVAGIEVSYPAARLDYVEAIMDLAAWRVALSNIDLYEARYGVNNRSRMLRASVLIGDTKFDKAAELLTLMPADDPNVMRLKAVLAQAKVGQISRASAAKRFEQTTQTIAEGIIGDTQQRDTQRLSDEALASAIKDPTSELAKQIDQLLSAEPNYVDDALIAAFCDGSILAGQIERAKAINAKFVERFPENATGLFYKQVLSEPEPGKVSQQRRKEISLRALSNIADPLKRAAGLGAYYYTENEPNKAAEEFQSVMDISSGQAGQETSAGIRRRAAEYLFDIALAGQNWKAAEEITQTAAKEDIDGCSGRFFQARLAAARGENETALTYIEDALKQRPVFAYGLLLRYRINAALGNEHASMQDIMAASGLNPMDKMIAKEMAKALYRRNQQLGSGVSSAQELEAKNAVMRAVALNPNDLQLISFYAEFISSTEPDKALAIRQSLQRTSPSLDNALLLAGMAMRMAGQKTQKERKDAFLGMAASALEQAKGYDPENKSVMEGYAEYYRASGQEDKAQQLLSQSQDWRMLTAYHIRAGRFNDARAVMEQAYKTNPRDPNVLKGLMFLVERTGDREAAKRYSRELLAVEDTVDNQLMMIQAFLNVGLMKEAQLELESFNEKNPNETRGLLLGAWLGMRQGRVKESLDQIKRYLQSDQKSAIGWRVKGEINLMLASYEEATGDFKKSIALADDPITRIYLAKAYLRSARVEDAITELKNTIENPQAPEEARALLESIYWRLGRKEALKGFYDETLSKLPESVFWRSRAASFAMTNEDYAGAERLYEQALRKSNEQGVADRNVLSGYLQALLSAGKLDILFQEAAKYVDGNLAPIAYFCMAEGKMKMGDKLTAIQYCRSAVDKAGNDEATAANVLNRMYSLLGAENVSQLCNDMLLAQPNSIPANWTMFNLAKLEGDYNKAVSYIDNCMKIVGTETKACTDYEIQKAETIILAYYKTADKKYLKEAVNQYESVLAKMPNNADVLNNVAYVLAENGEDIEKAVQYAKRACEARPNDPGLLDTYAFVLYKSGKQQEALLYVQSAIQQYDAQKRDIPPDVYEHAGQIQEALGEKGKAMDAYKQALEAGGDNMAKPISERVKSAVNRLSQ